MASKSFYKLAGFSFLAFNKVEESCQMIDD